MFQNGEEQFASKLTFSTRYPALRWIVAESGSPRHRANAEAVLRYLLKYTDMETGDALGLARFGVCGKVIGKRIGFTMNLSEQTQRCTL